MHRLDYLDRDIHAIFDNSIVFSGKQQQQTIDSMISPTVTRTFFQHWGVFVCPIYELKDQQTDTLSYEDVKTYC